MVHRKMSEVGTSLAEYKKFVYYGIEFLSRHHNLHLLHAGLIYIGHYLVNELVNTLNQIMPDPDPPPFPLKEPLAPIVQRLKDWLLSHDRLHSLDEAVRQALKSHIPQMTDWDITSGERFLEYASGMVNWISTENVGGKEIYWVLCLFYFVLDQPAINDLQTPIDANQIGKLPTYLSQWVVDYAQNMGNFTNTPASITTASINTFANSPRYNLDEAIVPPGGFKTFNQLFARCLKPGMRPISRPEDDRVIVYPADSSFDGAWDISTGGTVHINTYQIQTASIKGTDWPISALLQNSDYADKFNGGQWMHALLNAYDYHRQHAPVSGTIVEAKTIPGLAYLCVKFEKDEHGKNTLKPHRSVRRPFTPGDGKDGLSGDELDAPDDAGYEFLQLHGCTTIKNDVLGYVSVLPIVMAQVSSVKLHVKPNDVVRKGDEISHFEFGGSDIVVVFQTSASVYIFGEPNQKCLVGEVLGYASP